MLMFPLQYNDVSNVNDGQSVNLQNNVRVFSLKEKLILTWTFQKVMTSFECFNKLKGPNEAENKM
jgi:hypothetical protein